MQFPVHIHIGQLNLPLHFVFETLAYVIGYRYYLYLRRHTPDAISEQHRIIVFVGAAAGALLGSHIIGVLENPDLLHHFGLIYFMGNKTIVGGFVGGLIGVELTKKQLKVTASSGDIMVYPLILAMAIGRLGCFFSGMEDGTYGIPTPSPLGMDLGDGILRHCTNLYEIVFWLLLWLGLFLFERKYKFTNGSRFKVFMVAYLLFRIGIEFIKPAWTFSFGLSVIQLVCIGGLLYYYKVFLKPRNLIAHA